MQNPTNRSRMISPFSFWLRALDFHDQSEPGQESSTPAGPASKRKSVSVIDRRRVARQSSQLGGLVIREKKARVSAAGSGFDAGHCLGSGSFAGTILGLADAADCAFRCMIQSNALAMSAWVTGPGQSVQSGTVRCGCSTPLTEATPSAPRFVQP